MGRDMIQLDHEEKSNQKLTEVMVYTSHIERKDDSRSYKLKICVIYVSLEWSVFSTKRNILLPFTKEYRVLLLPQTP